MVVPHVELVQAGPVELGQQVQPEGHLVAAVVALGLAGSACNQRGSVSMRGTMVQKLPMENVFNKIFLTEKNIY